MSPRERGRVQESLMFTAPARMGANHECQPDDFDADPAQHKSRARTLLGQQDYGAQDEAPSGQQEQKTQEFHPASPRSTQSRYIPAIASKTKIALLYSAERQEVPHQARPKRRKRSIRVKTHPVDSCGDTGWARNG